MINFVKLGDVCSIKTGKLDANASSTNGEYPFFTCSKEPLKIESYSYDCECVLVAGNGDLNVKYYEGKFDAYQRTYIIEINNKNEFDTKYIYLLLESKINELRNQSIGGVIKYIKLGNLTDILVLKIPINSQKEIVNKFLKLNYIIELKKNQIYQFDNLIKSQFVEMFGDFNNSKYNKIKLDKIAKVGSSHRVFTTEFVEEGIPFYRGTEITMLANGINPQDCFYISKEHYDRISSDETKPKMNDLLTPSICDKGQIWLVETDRPFYYKDGRVLSISLKKDGINPKYLHYYMKNKTIEEYPKLGTGSTFAEFKIFLLKDMDIIVPPIELQDKFAQIVEQIDKQKSEFEESLKKLEELQATLMQEYFG